jgi:hypothetical protein
MLSVGPGDGELDLSFLAGVAETTGTGVDFVGLEPNANLRADFAKRLAADEATASGHTLTMLDEIFPRPAPGSGSRSSSTSTRTQDGSYDVVLMGHVLYYFDGPDDTAAALRAALRSAGPNGRVVVVHQAGTHHIIFRIYTAVGMRSCFPRVYTPSLTASNQLTIPRYLSIRVHLYLLHLHLQRKASPSFKTSFSLGYAAR